MYSFTLFICFSHTHTQLLHTTTIIQTLHLLAPLSSNVWYSHCNCNSILTIFQPLLTCRWFVAATVLGRLPIMYCYSYLPAYMCDCTDCASVGSLWKSVCCHTWMIENANMRMIMHVNLFAMNVKLYGGYFICLNFCLLYIFVHSK